MIEGATIMRLMKDAGFTTQAALAEASELDPSKLSALVNNKPVNLTLKSVERMAKALKVPVGRLFEEPRPEESAGHVPLSPHSGIEALIAALDDEFPAEDSVEGDIHKAIAALTRALRRGRPAASAPGQAAKARR